MEAQAKHTQTVAMVEYETEHGKVKLSPGIIRRYLVSGDGRVSDQEVMMFLQLCRYQGLNPFLREAYLIKFASNPAAIVVGKEVFTKRAIGIKECRGWKAGIVVQTADGRLVERDGTLLLNGEALVGGWAEVYREGWEAPLKHTVTLDEYQRRTKDGSIQRNWRLPKEGGMAPTMIRKVALVQALREAYPSRFQGMYSVEEMPIETADLPETPVAAPEQGGETIDAAYRETDPSEAEPLAEADEPEADPATPKQLGYIRGLAKRVGDDSKVRPVVDEILGSDRARALWAAHGEAETAAVGVTKTEASAIIEQLEALVPQPPGPGPAASEEKSAGTAAKPAARQARVRTSAGGNGGILQAQIAAIARLADGAGWDNDRVIAELQGRYGKSDITELSSFEAADLIKAMQEPGGPLFGNGRR